MHLTLAGTDALRVLRALRCNKTDVGALVRGDLEPPNPDPFKRFRANRLDLQKLLLDKPPSQQHPLQITTPSREDNLRAGFVRNIVVPTGNVPPNSFIDVGDGIQIPCPELIFLQVTSQMMPLIQLALGMELCGDFSRDPQNPTDGSPVLGLAPVTSARRIQTYLSSCQSLPGLNQARYIASFLSDNAWSAMEGAVGALFSLPFGYLGYDLAPLTLNKRITSTSSMLSDKDSRVPDILFQGSHVGLNYDGGDHLALGEIVDAATDAVLHPEDAIASANLQTTVKRVREKYVDDHRRDRELWAQGLMVMPITIEDVREKGRLDSIASWVMDQLEAEGARDLSTQRAMLQSPAIARARQRVIWSLLPGELGRKARIGLVQAKRDAPKPQIVYEGTIEW